MKGANEYCEIFRKGQHGRLYLYPSSHARGPTFAIYLLPEGAVVESGEYPWGIKDHVEVYGMVSGQRGWTETYDWIHRGKWCEDFQTLIDERKKEIAIREEKRAQVQARKDIEAQDKLSGLLKSY